MSGIGAPPQALQAQMQGQGQGPVPGQVGGPGPNSEIAHQHQQQLLLQQQQQQQQLIDPWADALDEVDPRELAMGRFRMRQEVLGEIFSPEPIRECNDWLIWGVEEVVGKWEMGNGWWSGDV